MAAVAMGCAAIAGASVAQGNIFHAGASPVVHEQSRMGDWRLDIARERFSGAVACRLYAANGSAIYRAGAVGFRFPRHWNVTGAVYRLDMGAAQPSRDDLPRLIALGTPIDSGAMDNPTGGIVWVPYEKLIAGPDSKAPTAIAIEPKRGKSARPFSFRGLAALHDAAVSKGCDPESRFVDR